jgi:hypothetical protein
MLAGPFCHRCGQDAVELRAPLRTLGRDALGDLLTLDSRILRTLGPLLVRPGYLTGEWTAGRRVPYVPPLRLYVFVAALFFLLLAITDVRLAEVELGDDGLASAEVSAGDMARITLHENPAPPPVAAAEEGGGLREEVLTGFQERLERRFAGNPDDFQDDLVDRLGRSSLLMAPLFALLLALVYRRRRRYLVEHVVFALHVHAFVFLFLGLVAVLLPAAGGLAALLRLASVLVLVLYLVLALQRVYGGRGWVTLLRTGLLVVLYVVAIFLPTLFLAFVWTVYGA